MSSLPLNWAEEARTMRAQMASERAAAALLVDDASQRMQELVDGAHVVAELAVAANIPQDLEIRDVSKTWRKTRRSEGFFKIVDHGIAAAGWTLAVSSCVTISVGSLYRRSGTLLSADGTIMNFNGIGDYTSPVLEGSEGSVTPLQDLKHLDIDQIRQNLVAFIAVNRLA